MYEIRIEKYFSAAHSLRGYKGKCENLHGHNWKIEVIICSEKLNKIGLIYDFTEVKNFLEKILKKYDHKNLNDITPFNKVNPSSENIAKTIFDKMKSEYPVKKVICWESNNSYATYSETSDDRSSCCCEN